MTRQMTMRSRWCVRNSAGICLAELMIALAAGAIVLSAAVQSLAHFGNRLSVQQDAVESDQDLRIGLMVMVEELRRVMVGPSGAMVVTMGRQEVTFLGNLDGATAVMTEAAGPGQLELKVVGATGWGKGKRVMLCDDEQCREARLARDGQKTAVQLTAPLGRGFAQGTTIWLVSQVRYYLGNDQFGRTTLMRQIDGGTNPLIGDLTWVEFRYLDKEGQPTEDPARTGRIRIAIKGRNGQQPTIREVGLQTL